MGSYTEVEAAIKIIEKSNTDFWQISHTDHTLSFFSKLDNKEVCLWVRHSINILSLVEGYNQTYRVGFKVNGATAFEDDVKDLKIFQLLLKKMRLEIRKGSREQEAYNFLMGRD